MGEYGKRLGLSVAKDEGKVAKFYLSRSPFFSEKIEKIATY